jgi:hypothetical protein
MAYPLKSAGSTSLLLAGLLVINHVKTELLLLKTGSQPGSAVCSGTMLGIGLSSCLSLALMVNPEP